MFLLFCFVCLCFVLFFSSLFLWGFFGEGSCWVFVVVFCAAVFSLFILTAVFYVMRVLSCVGIFLLPFFIVVVIIVIIIIIIFISLRFLVWVTGTDSLHFNISPYNLPTVFYLMKLIYSLT